MRLLPEHSLFYLLIVHVFLSCQSPVESTKENPPATIPIRIAKPQKLNTSVLRPFNFNLTGMLGQDTVEMFISYDPMDILKDPDCIKVQGDFNFSRQQISTKKLEGDFCFDTGIATLHHRSNQGMSFAFRGIFAGQIHQFKGKWSDTEKTKNEQFEFLNEEQHIASKSLHHFATKIDQHFSVLDQINCKKVAVDQLGICIHDLDWTNLKIKYFSPSKLHWNSWSDVPGQNFHYQEAIDLWHYDQNENFVIIIHAQEWQLIDNKEVETEKTEVWHWSNQQLKNILLNKDKPISEAVSKLYAFQKDEIIQLIDSENNQIWEWTL